MGETLASRDAHLWNLIEDSDFITTDGFMRFTDTRPDLLYWKRDLVTRGGSWRGVKYPPLVAARKPPAATTVVLGHSDLMTGTALQMALKARGYWSLWGTNVRARLPHASALPLGLTNDCDDSPLHRILGNTDHLRQAFMSTERPTHESGTVMACFSLNTSPRHREPLAALIREDHAFRWYDPDLSETGRIRFMSRLRTHDFVLCPRGNGTDTHRLWETLYMGGIPIVRRADCWVSLLADLPVVIVDEWPEVMNPEFRSREWHRVNSTQWSASPLRQSTWNSRIGRLSAGSG